MVDLGFDIAVVLCGVNDGKKFFVGGGRARAIVDVEQLMCGNVH